MMMNSKQMALYSMMEERGYSIPIVIDGGVDMEKGKKLKELGADILVVGSFVFYSEDISKTVQDLKSL